MSSIDTPLLARTPLPTGADATPDATVADWRIKALMIVPTIGAAVGICALAVLHGALPEGFLKAIAPVLATVVAIMLAGFPIVIGFVQAISRDRQISKLKGIAAWPVAATTSYRGAYDALLALRPASVSAPDFRVPMLCFCFTVVLCSLSVFLFYSFPELMAYHSVILGGAEALKPDDATVAAYQAGTFTAIAYAFFGAYVSVIHRLLARIINNDIYPMSFHGYTAWILCAGLIAGVMRHVVGVFNVDVGAAGLVLVGFATGLAPSLFVVAIARRVFDLFNIIGDKRDPDKTSLPSNKNLLMIDGIDSDEGDRLGELGVGNAQILASQNPFILWPRLPYELGLLVSWIAQAQLYTRVQDTGLQVLREAKIGDIFDLDAALTDAAARPGICTLLKIDPDSGSALAASLNADPRFIRLKAVRDAMAIS